MCFLQSEEYEINGNILIRKIINTIDLRISPLCILIRIIYNFSSLGKKIKRVCDSKGNMSPLSAKVKCPHQGGGANDGRDIDES